MEIANTIENRIENCEEMTHMESKAVKGAKDGITEDYYAAKKKVRLEFDRAKAKLSKMQHRAEGYITRNPKKATAIAVGLGAAIGAAVTSYWKRAK